MKKWILNILATTGLMLAFVLTVTPPLARSAAGAPPAPQERQEGFQDLRRAEQLLREARTVLTAAQGEYGGHRDKAIKHIDEAIGQIHEAYEHH
jgi:hypothetical protein